MNGIDLDGFLERLNEFDALRADDTIKTGAVDRIQQVGNSSPDPHAEISPGFLFIRLATP